MSKYLYLIFSVILQTIVSQSVPKLQVEVLYESLCPDSLSFITQQLHPVFSELAPYIDLKLIPFGKSASLQDGLQFVCQHGPQECKGNKIQSCALSAIADQTVKVDYVNCFMQVFKKEQRGEGALGQSCAEAAGVDVNQLYHCFSSTVGINLQLLAEKDTQRLSPKFVPTIVYNGVFDQKLQDDSFVNFRGVVCQLLSATYPEACQSTTVIRL